MLSRDDARVVDRDRGLPGLRIVLDPERFAEWLRRNYREAGIREAHPRYLRYKPGTSCLMTYAVDWAGGSAVLAVKAYRPPAADKLAKAARLRAQRTPLGSAAVVSEDIALAATVLPYDLKIRKLRDLLGTTAEGVLDGLLPIHAGTPHLRVLSYKPERRAVLRADGITPRAVVRVYSAREYATGAGRRIVSQPPGVQLARTLAIHQRYPVTVTEWLDGDDGSIAFASADRAAAIGEVLARLHSAACTATWTRSADDERRQLHDVASGLSDLLPAHAARLNHLAGALGECLDPLSVPALTHGDFAARQVVFTARGAAMIDLDEAAAGHPATDIGSFLADIEYRVICGELEHVAGERSAAGFLDGYSRIRAVPTGFEAYFSAHLLRLAPTPFRARVPDWQSRVEEVIARCESLPWRPRVLVPIATGAAPIQPVAPPAASDQEPDATMPWLGAALDPLRATRLFRDLGWSCPDTRVRSASILRHKRGRRCLVRYDMSGPVATVFGKTRAKGLDLRTARLNERLYGEGFGAGSADGIEVPPFLGRVPPLRMWLQAAVSGESASDRLTRGDGGVARRLAEAIAKVQRLGPLPERTHTIEDECRILEERLAACTDRHPEWRDRLARLFDGCEALRASLLDAPLVPAHRDFYPDQILVAGSRFVLLDFDLYALAHPALDAGNCIAHVIELGLRPDAARATLDEAALAMREAMAAALPGRMGRAIDVFTMLTLVRLIDIDDRLDHRRACVEPLLAVCEERLGRANALGPRRSRIHVPGIDRARRGMR